MVIMGDFNEVSYPNEREGQIMFDVGGVAKFNALIEDISVVEVRSIRGFYMWNNCSIRGHLARSRLDRSLANLKWIEK